MSKMRPATGDHARLLRLAIGALKEARGYLKRAGCPQTLRRVRLALTSAQGAERHMNHRLSRTRPDGTVRKWDEQA